MYSRILFAVFISFVSMMLTLILCIPAFAAPSEKESYRLPQFDQSFQSTFGEWVDRGLARLQATLPTNDGDDERPPALTGLNTAVSYSLKPIPWRAGPDRWKNDGAADMDVNSVESLSVQSRYHFGSATALIPYAAMSLGLARVPGTPTRTGGWANDLDDAYSTAYSYQGSLGIKSLLGENLIVGVSYRYRLLEEGGYGFNANDRGDHKFFAAIDYQY